MYFLRGPVPYNIVYFQKNVRITEDNDIYSMIFHSSNFSVTMGYYHST
jgi:hypothetical protein